MKATKKTKSVSVSPIVKTAAPADYIPFSAFCVSVDDKWSKPNKRKKF